MMKHTLHSCIVEFLSCLVDCFSFFRPIDIFEKEFHLWLRTLKHWSWHFPSTCFGPQNVTEWFASWVWQDSHEQMLVGNYRPAQRSSSLLLAAACSLVTLAILTCSPHACLPPKPHSLPSHPWPSRSQSFKMVHLWPHVPKSQPHQHCHHEIAKASQMWDMPTHFPEPVKLA
jgi:hypothetical protein